MADPTFDPGAGGSPLGPVTDTRAARYVRDRNGNLNVYNAKGQYLDTIALKDADAFIARFNQGQTDLATDYSPEGLAAAAAKAAKTAGGGAGDGPAWANANLRGAELEQGAKQFGQTLAEQRRQYDETFGADKAKFNTEMQFTQAKQNWQQAVDARDFDAAEYWKGRAQELNQNQLAMQYTNMLAGLTGPQDWIKYGRLSRQESPLGTPDGQTVPLDQALPAWARGFQPGTYPDSRGKAPGAFADAGQRAAPPVAPPGGQAPLGAPPASMFQPKAAPPVVAQAGAIPQVNVPTQVPVGSSLRTPGGSSWVPTPTQTTTVHPGSDYFEKGGQPIVPAPRTPSAPTDFSFVGGQKPAWFEAAMAGKPTGAYAPVRK